MGTYDTIIRNAQVVTPEGIQSVDVALSGRQIAALLQRGEGVATNTIDATGQHLLPGAIDIHFHVRAPAFPERGTVESETRAAAAGGITTLFEMPISKPCCNTAERVEVRRAHFAEHAFINFGLYAAPGDLDHKSVAAMADAGVVAYKIFTTTAPEGRDDEFFGLSFPDEADQLRALKAVATTGLPLVVHSESAQLLAAAEVDVADLDHGHIDTHLASRPGMCEAVAVAKLLTMNIEAKAKLHIAHVTSAMTVEVLRRFAGTSDFSAESCPHYLFRTHDDVRRAGVFAKINPPVRLQADQDALWQAIRDGVITHVTTDHAAFSQAEKLAGAGNMVTAPPGTPGSEVLVPGVLDAVAKGRITLEHAVALLSGNAAKRFNLPKKGRIAEGADADLILVDLAAITTIAPETLLTFARDVAQLYYGAAFSGRVMRTLVAGQTIFDGTIRGEPGWGQYTSPARTVSSQTTRLSA